ncbi:hypothetical protein J2I47_18700 [Fibrella sp. HMF5335]|uniref:Uncharacterized protein n=1 Tax=Fibrella rubiginis TaxID=2817060 RepID=A0A939K4N0_9BACT|nr:hypothetical protein [Fibrella rubiginis]MBO0938589.1 hypothetical protein [Fibrella rubiginis]
MGLIKPIGTLEKTLSKTGIVRLAADHAKQIIDSGQYDLLKTYVEMKRYEVYIKTIIAQLKNHSVAQAQELRAITQQPTVAPLGPAAEAGESGVSDSFANLPVPTTSATSLDDTDDDGADNPIVRQNTINYNSGSVQITKRTTYDFTQDAEWQRLTTEIASLKLQLKQREEYLKTQEDTPAFTQENVSVRL